MVEEDVISFKASELETFRSQIRIETILQIVQDAQSQHEKEDKEVFGKLFDKLRDNEKSIHELDKADQALGHKIDRMWLKIVLPLSGVIAVGFFIQYTLVVANLASKLTG